MNLNLEIVTLRSGATVEVELIHHLGAPAIVPMKDDGTVLFVRQCRHPVGGYVLEAPVIRMSTVQQTMAAAEKQANDILAGK